MSATRVAVFGLGRSGLSVAKLAKKNGIEVRVYDEKTEAALPKPELYREAVQEGIPVSLGWTGEFAPDDFSSGERPDGLVANPAVPKTHRVLASALAEGVSVWSEIEFAYRHAQAPIVAMTGTNGKSTTTVMTYLALRGCGIDAVLCGNIFGSGYPEQTLTEAAANGTADQILVAEVSSFQLEWVDEFRPVSAGITNIWPDHLDRYEGFEEYAQTKHRIFARQTAGDFAVVKANDPSVTPPGGSGTRYRGRRARSAGSSEQAGPQVLTFGATGEHAKVDDLELSILNERVRLDDLPFSEPHNYLNAAMAGLLAYGGLSGAAQRFGNRQAETLLAEAREAFEAKRTARRSVYEGRLPEAGLVLPPGILAGLREFRGLAHRMEFLGVRDGVRVINNSMCTNPDAVIKSAMAVRDPAHLLIGGVNKGLDFGPLRHYLANRRHRAYLFGTDAADLNEMLGGDHPVFATMQEAFRAASSVALSGEVLMLAPGCASTDQFRDFRDRGDVFRDIAKEWLSQ